MGAAKRRRPATDSSLNSNTPARKKPSSARGRGRPPNAPRDGRERPPPLAECFKQRCGDVLDRLSKKDHYDIFLEPVKGVAGYLDIIKRPMDLSTVRSKLMASEYKSLGEFRKDLDLIWSNCLLFNGKEPTNVFSKKAIELRRLTDKLIVNTRQQLEKDKEVLHRWKEKYRKRRETMAANAAMLNARLHGSASPYSPANSVRTSRIRDLSDPMASADFTSDYHSGRSPEENAIAEVLRLQYAGTTGLYKRSMLNAPMPQYTKPDGSIAHIPIVRYNPRQDHWAPADPVEAHTCRRDSIPPLLCDSLPASRLCNPCTPDPRTDFVYVSDYAESLYHFVRGSGSIASDIVTEILSPELMLRAQHERLRNSGLSPKEVAMAIKAENAVHSSIPLHKPLKLWNKEAITELADDIDRINGRMFSILPKMQRTINEYNGIDGLRKFLDEDLIKEVENTPSQIVDFSMPHGVSLATLSDIVRLAAMSAIRISANEAKRIEALQKHAQRFLSQLRPETAAKIVNNPAQQTNVLVEFQRRRAEEKKQRRVEAEKQAALIVQQMRKVALPPKEPLPSMKQENPNSSAKGPQQLAASQTQKVNASVLEVSAQRNPQLGLLGHNQVPSAVPPNALGRPSAAFTAAGLSIDAKITCSNCGTTNTPRWRTNELMASRDLCIPCGLFWEKTRQMRPKDFATQSSFFQSMQKPIGTQNGRTQMSATPNQLQTIIPGLSPNGVSKPPIQKKTPQSVSRRSPSSNGSGRGPRTRIPHGVILDQRMGVMPNANLLQGFSRSFPGVPIQQHVGQANPQRANMGGSVLDVLAARAGNQDRFNIGQQLQRPGPPSFVNAKAGTVGAQMKEPAHASSSINSAMFSRPPGVEIGGSQSIGIIPSSESLQRQNLLQQSIPQTQQGFQNMGASNFNPLAFRGTNPTTMFNPTNLNAQNPPNAGNQGFIPEGGIGVALQKISAQNNRLLMGQRLSNFTAPTNGATGAEGMAVSGGSGGNGIGNPNFGTFPTQSGNPSIASIPSVNDMRGSQGINVPVSETPDQMMENLLFGVGGIASSPSGPPEFDF
ncbi:Bromodomain containing protein [Gracilaria domingensis]|nr:Bromodomain containing protein [Gracilaria domingensis]